MHNDHGGNADEIYGFYYGADVLEGETIA